jgi:hypothetical protein
MRRSVERNVSVGGRVRVERTARDRSVFSNQVQVSNDRELIARFFMDLRRALRLTLPQAAYYLKVPTSVVEALETGQVEYLPPWPQTVQIVMGYTSMAGVDGRPVVNAVGNLLVMLQQAAAEEPEAQQPGNNSAQPAGHFLRAGSAIASGARRLPMDAMHQIRERPQRALYALSLPLFVLLFFHASIFQVVAQPFSMAVDHVSVYFQEHFAPVKDGLRWIDVNDPRSRRTDKLRIAGGSY